MKLPLNRTVTKRERVNSWTACRHRCHYITNAQQTAREVFWGVFIHMSFFLRGNCYAYWEIMFDLLEIYQKHFTVLENQTTVCHIWFLWYLNQSVSDICSYPIHGDSICKSNWITHVLFWVSTLFFLFYTGLGCCIGLETHLPCKQLYLLFSRM